jgi:hypothetical protein
VDFVPGHIKKRFKRAVERTVMAMLPYRLSRTLGFVHGLASKRISYSQYGEDLILLNYFDRMGIENGVYVDIGCFHPTWLSNTHLLHKRGWRGYAVDIDRYKLKAFEFMRRGRCETILGAVGPGDGNGPRSVEAYKFKRLFWSEMDTLDRDTADRYRQDLDVDYYVDHVPLIDARTLFARIPRVNLINIDIEGLDEDVLKSIDLDKLRPEAVVFEDNRHWGGSEAIKSFLGEKGYERLFVSGGSICYAKPCRFMHQVVRRPIAAAPSSAGNGRRSIGAKRLRNR